MTTSRIIMAKAQPSKWLVVKDCNGRVIIEEKLSGLRSFQRLIKRHGFESRLIDGEISWTHALNRSCDIISDEVGANKNNSSYPRHRA